LIDSAEVVENVLDRGQPVLINLDQTRPLTLLKIPTQQKAAWQKAVKTAPDGEVAASHVAKIVKEMPCTGLYKRHRPRGPCQDRRGMIPFCYLDWVF
jgi:hypothetical protein